MKTRKYSAEEIQEIIEEFASIMNERFDKTFDDFRRIYELEGKDDVEVEMYLENISLNLVDKYRNATDIDSFDRAAQILREKASEFTFGV